ncbi:unnamed protein product [Porites lobata]|uniref:DNA-directed DNA polymerase n=1 Tax=Porites lobata TaxID=104759 RepID=A0ABN8NRV6_9CNID|nr:unnamed protein product [Porites lobata]
MVKSKNSCVEITNKDDLCCARALVTARAYQHKDQSSLQMSKYTTIRQGRDLQKTKARELHRLAKVPEGPCGLPEIRDFEKFPSMQDFMTWVWHLRVTDPGRRPFVLIAHNFQGYDGYLLLEELYRQAVVPSQIVNGAKLLSVAIPGGIKFIDSLNFFPMALASFP